MGARSSLQMGSSDRSFAEAIAEVARGLEAEGTAIETLQKMVELAVSTIAGCDHAGVSLVNEGVETPVASDDVPRQVDRLQYEAGEGPCLDAIWKHDVFQAGDLRSEDRWPDFSSRAARETGVRSMQSFRLFLERDTLGALNLYSKRPGAFDDDSRRVGKVFAAHAAIALRAARERERIAELEQDLRGSRQETRRYARQAEIAVALQRSMLTELPDLSPLRVAARYVPATEAVEVGGDWYDAFRLPGGAPALVVGDLAGHDIQAAVSMGQARNVLRALAVDRREFPGELLARLDAVLSQLQIGQTGTCVYAQLDERDGAWQARLANAGHPPPLLIADRAASYLERPPEPLLGTGVDQPRSTATVALRPGATLLLYTDGLVERRGRSIDDGLAELRSAAVALSGRPVDELCDELLARFAAAPDDDVCLLAVRTPTPKRPS
jgi:serine phosphatase RsbU (regulator of sigma subunit)